MKAIWFNKLVTISVFHHNFNAARESLFVVTLLTKQNIFQLTDKCPWAVTSDVRNECF